MKILFLILFLFFGLLFVGLLYSQEPAYYHDVSLDSINGGVGNLDADFNFQFNRPKTNSSSDWLTQSNIDTDISNSYSSIQTTFIPSITNSANAFSSNLVSAWTNVIGGNTITNDFSSIGSGDPSLSVIDLGFFRGHDFKMDFSSNIFSTPQMDILHLIRLIIKIFLYITVFAFSVRYLQSEAFAVMNQRQNGGLQQTLFGTNADAPTGILYAVIISGAIVGLLGYFATQGLIKSSFVWINQFSPTLSQIALLPGWDVFTSVFPITDACGLLCSYLTFRYIFAFPIFLSVRSLMLLLLR